jgi:cobalt-zinc-cadmium efflux system membrane fusion protein
MTRRSILIAAAFLASCGTHDHEGADDHGHAHGDEADERPALAFTDWTDVSELFVELPALVRGQPSPCAAHVTKLDGFTALADGRVTVVLRGGPSEERFDVHTPTVPGIFRPVARPATSGRRRLIVEIRANGLSADHDLGDVVVFDSVVAARHAIPETPEVSGRITFLKEQQWPIAFATAPVRERGVRPSLRASGRIRARSDGEVVVVAPVAGRVLTNGEAFPLLGATVSANDVLAVISPRLDAADVASLELAVTSANLEVRFADRERQRLEGLRIEGAVPERRVSDAAHVADEARASLNAAERRLGQFRGVARSTARGAGAVRIVSPLSGTITAVFVAPGTFVEAGTPLLRVTDLTRVWLEVRVAASDVPRLGTPRGCSFVVDGVDAPVELPAASMIARGHEIDPVTQTLPLMFVVENTDAPLALNTFARVLVATGDERTVVAVPEASLVDDGGVFVVFVQVEGEAFERRVVRVGVRDRGYVEVSSGVRMGEHVVTRGAWSVKLAAASGVIPAHGHAH